MSLLPFRGFAPVALSLAVATVLAATPVGAASCAGASHQVTLSSGSVSPGSGTTRTVFTFSVVYTSNADCPPSVTVTVNGVGTYSMSGAGTNYAAGVPFRLSVTLPPGSRGYSFHATSGSGPGSQSVTLGSVSPSTVTVAYPAPVIAPQPETPSPTPSPSPTATPSPAATVESSIGPSAPASRAPRPGGWGTLGTFPPSEPTVNTGAAHGAGIQSAIPGFLGWLMATAGGLYLFVFLSRRSLEVESQFVERRSSPERPPNVGMPALDRRPRQAGGETQIARWLRPSVQAARYADPGRDGRLAED